MIGRMHGMRAGAILLACALTGSLLVGPTTHAVVPHEHGHSHGSEPSYIWQDLHAALRHENKSTFVAAILPLVLVGTALTLLTFFAYPLGLLGTIAVLDPHRGHMLTRGILAHRRFR